MIILLRFYVTDAADLR